MSDNTKGSPAARWSAVKAGLSHSVEAVLGCNDLRCKETAASCHNLERLGTAILAHQQRHDNAPCADGWKNSANVGRLLAAPHIGGRD